MAKDIIKILFVDDEDNILSTLRRLMSFEDYDCDYAHSGEEALLLLAEERHNIIVSDMRMPKMNGDELLTRAKEIHPDSVRFILSGYSDFQSMMNALNRGGVHQFISKPWDDDVLLEKINEAADFIRVRRDRDRLEKLTRKQAAELKTANQQLEARVEARTQELKQTADMLDLSYSELKASYNIFIDVIAQVLQLRSVAPKDHLNDIAETSRDLCRELGYDEQMQDDVYKAAKLHELGKVSIPDTILKKPLTKIQGKELEEYKQYPMHGYSLMTSLDNLGEVANLIRSHCESYNGHGFPMRLLGKNIPIGARIIGIVMHYFNYRNGLTDGFTHNSEQCEEFIRRSANKRTDPNLIDPFLKTVNLQLKKKGKFESRIQITQARSGQVLSRDLFNNRGMIMLTKGTMLNDKIITKLKYIADKDETQYALYIDNKLIKPD
ncbi:MAG: response regulator [Reinekea sp.]